MLIVVLHMPQHNTLHPIGHVLYTLPMHMQIPLLQTTIQQASHCKASAQQTLYKHTVPIKDS